MKHKLKSLSKKTISLALAIVLVVSCFLANADMLTLAASYAYETDTVLAENDYSDAVTGLTPWYFGNTSGDSYPAVDPLDSTNTVMQYKQDWYGKGAIFLGAKFDSSEPGEISSLVKEQAVQAKENVAYEVEYDYYVTGTPNTTMEISLAVGDNVAVESWDAPNITVSYSEKIKELAAGIDASTGAWIRDQKATITLPADADFSNGKYLMLYTTACSAATIYFDNIKVTALAGVDVEYHIDGDTETIYYADGVVKEYTKTNASGKTAIWYTDSACTTPFSVDTYVRTGTYTTLKLYGNYPKITYDKDTVLTENDYNGALTQLDGADVWPGLFVGSSGDTIPVNDPKDNSNQAMMYSQYWYGKGALFLGSDYTTYASETIKNESVKVEAGVTYEVKYDFYAQGEVKHELGLNVSLAVGTNTGNDSSSEYTITTAYQQTIAQYTCGHQFEMSAWKRDNIVRITIPEDADLSQGSYLMILTEHGAADADLYFDNIKVTALQYM